MKRRIALIAVCISSLVMCVTIALTMQSRFSFAQTLGSDGSVWHHYNRKEPTESEKGIKEYWVQCGGSYQFTAPSGTIIDKGSNYNTSEFAPNDDRWITFCDVHGHQLDAHDVCTVCLEHKSAKKIANYAVSDSTLSNKEAPKGFNYVYSVTGKANGYCGYDINISSYNFIYFALYAEGGYIRPFSGGDDGDGTHRIVWSGRWFYLLVEKLDNKWNGFIKDGVSGAWYTRTVDGTNDTNLKSLLRFYNWDNANNQLAGVTIYSTEVYAGTELPPEMKTNPINIGVWNGSYHFTNTSGIDDLVDAGFNTTIGINPLWNSNWNSILNYSKNKGVKHIVDPRGWDYDNSCYADWDGTAPSYASHDAIDGFLMWDEPSTKNYSTIAQMKSTFKSVMPSDKKFFVNMLSGAASMSMLYGTESAQSTYSYYETNYVNAYENTVHPDVYSFDSYPLFSNGQIRKSYFCTLDIWSNLARSTDVPIWYTLLSSSHNSGDGAGYSYVLPSQAQLEWQMSVALSFGVTNLMHYIYATDASDYSCMANIDGSKNAYFDTVKAANKNIHALDNDITKFGWEGATTYHNNSKVNLLFKDLQHTVSNASVGFNSISATSDLLIGSYIDDNNNRAYMVTNSGISTDYSSTWDSKYTNYNKNIAYSNDANSVTLTFNNNIVGAYVIQNGSKTYVSANNNAISLYLTSFGNAFVIPVK